jgi:hypothetical protein
MGGPWTYDGGHKFRMHGPAKTVGLSKTTAT